MKNKNSRQIENAKMTDCRAVKWERDTLKKTDAYQTADSALKKIMKEKIKDEILKKWYNCEISCKTSLELLCSIILLLIICRCLLQRWVEKQVNEEWELSLT